ncbi:MAG: tripartite tricarboxylate transporter substrate binding protein [Betaproteobacteria bacterium]|nr:tripartite tricarboxylate transporter substrate binding protein [Betaproteobacteria bacterium]
MKPAMLIRSCTLALTTAVFSGAVLAQAWPSKPVRLLVPFGPGSGTDTIARVVADGLSESLKQPVVVENREGAGGLVGTRAAMTMPADGYTVVAISNAFLIAPQLFKAAPYDPTRDFTALSKVAAMPMTIVVGASSPFRTMKDLIDYIRANPGKASFATSGKGAQSHLEIEYIKQQLRLNAVDIPYKSTGAAIGDTISNTVTFYMPVFPPVASNVASGKLRALAIGAPSRLPALPDIPTYIEATGIANYVPTSWFGYVVLAGTPAEAVAKLDQGIAHAATLPRVRDKIQGVGANMSVAPSREFAAEIRSEAEKWSKLINELGLRTE